MELFTRQAAVALFFGLFATSTQAKEFSYLETFDDDATFSAGATLPDGWLLLSITITWRSTWAPTRHARLQQRS